MEALGRLIPIGADSLGSQLYLFVALVYDLAKAEVRNLDLPVVENYVLGLQVVVNDLLVCVIQIFEPA